MSQEWTTCLIRQFDIETWATLVKNCFQFPQWESLWPVGRSGFFFPFQFYINQDQQGTNFKKKEIYKHEKENSPAAFRPSRAVNRKRFISFEDGPVHPACACFYNSLNTGSFIYSEQHIKMNMWPGAPYRCTIFIFSLIDFQHCSHRPLTYFKPFISL